MNFRILLFASVFTGLIFTSCVRSYNLANQSFETRKLPVPYIEKEEENSSFYLGAAYERYTGTNINAYNLASPDDDYATYALNAHYAKAKGYYYFAYGATGYVGQYELTSFPIEEIQGNKSLWGLGLTGELGLNIPTAKFNIRPIGVKLSGLMEKGEYARFRSTWLDTNIQNTTYINGNEDDYLLNVSTIFGISYSSNEVLLGLDILTGYSNTQSPFGVNLYFGYNHLLFFVNYNRALNYGKSSLQVGLNYTFSPEPELDKK